MRDGAVERGVTFFDTAEVYGPYTNEELVGEALANTAKDLGAWVRIAPNGTVTIALWGDSHAAQWFTPLDSIARTHGWRLLSLTQGSCSFLDITVYDRKNNREFGNCAPWREAARAYMVEQQVSVVFVSQHYGLLDTDTKQAIAPQRWSDSLDAMQTAFTKEQEKLSGEKRDARIKAINDKQAEVLSFDIANKIQNEMTYPGQVKVTVIRETRSVNYAK